MTRVQGPDDELVHLSEKHQRETLCGESKVNWSYPEPWNATVDCQICRDAFVGMVVRRAVSWMKGPSDAKVPAGV